MIDLAFFKKKRVFITGHTGFKGTWLTHILLDSGADVFGFSLEPPTKPSLFELSGVASRIQSNIGDVRDCAALVKSVQKNSPEIVFHLAAQPIVRLSYQEPALTFETNVLGTVNILEAVRASPSIRSFVNVTTDKVYENKEWHWGYRENDNLCGLDPYSNSKSCSELVTFSYRNSFFHPLDSPAISTARSGNVIGGGDFAQDRIIPDCIRSAQAGEKIIIRNPRSIRPYQHVLECLSGYLLLAQRQYLDKTLEGSYNFGPDDDNCLTTGELADLFCEYWTGVGWRAQGDNGPHEANFLKLDCSKSKTVLGWKPSWDIRMAIAKTIEFTKTTSDPSRCLQNQIKEYFHL